jgi:nucleoside-diphosphate-sugar epimerase
MAEGSRDTGRSGAAPGRAADRQQRTVAVLGGTGFLGSAVVRHLIEGGHDVVVVARRALERPGPDRVRAMDLAEAPASAIADMLAAERVNAVVNAAGGMWGLTDAEMVAANSTLVRRLIEAAAQLPDRPRLVQIGSVHEYGVVPIGTDIDEKTPPQPVQPYGAEKLRCTEAVTAATTAGRIDAVTLRVGNVVGAGQPKASLLGGTADRLATARRDGGTIRLELGPLDAQRDFIGLHDTVRAVESALTASQVRVPVINIGRGVAAPARELVHTLVEISGVPAELAEAPPDGESEQTWQRLRVDLAAEVLGWAPQPDLRGELVSLWEGAEAVAAWAPRAECVNQ